MDKENVKPYHQVLAGRNSFCVTTDCKNRILNPSTPLCPICKQRMKRKGTDPSKKKAPSLPLQVSSQSSNIPSKEIQELISNAISILGRPILGIQQPFSFNEMWCERIFLESIGRKWLGTEFVRSKCRFCHSATFVTGLTCPRCW